MVSKQVCTEVVAKWWTTDGQYSCKLWNLINSLQTLWLRQRKAAFNILQMLPPPLPQGSDSAYLQKQLILFVQISVATISNHSIFLTVWGRAWTKFMWWKTSKTNWFYHCCHFYYLFGHWYKQTPYSQSKWDCHARKLVYESALILAKKKSIAE